MDEVRAALQAVLDRQGEGWQVAHFVCVVGLERVRSDSMDIGAIWLGTESGQAGYVTDGLLIAAEQVRAEEREQA